jgi:hypothetical protein
VSRADEHAEALGWALLDEEIRKGILRHLWDYFVFMDVTRERLTSAEDYGILTRRMQDVERLLGVLEEMEPEDDDEEGAA